MTESQDYYHILGLSKDASIEEIRKAYREMALKCHPDKAPAEKKKEAEEQFKKISEAYAVLSDPDKKAFYDHKGYSKLHEKYTSEDLFGGTDFGSIFENLSGFGLGEGLFNSFFNLNPLRNHPHPEQVSIEISLEESVFGATKEIAISQKRPCPDCPKIATIACPYCQQKGQIRSSQGNMHLIQTCPYCHGKGSTAEKICATCQGSGSISLSEKIQISIPPGIENGSSLSLSFHGKPIIVTLEVKPHALFERKEKNLITHLTIPFTLAILGGETKVPTLFGNVIMTIPPGTQNGKIFRLKGKGIPGSSCGDELVVITIEIPTYLTPKQKQLIEDFVREQQSSP